MIALVNRGERLLHEQRAAGVVGRHAENKEHGAEIRRQRRKTGQVQVLMQNFPAPRCACMRGAGPDTRRSHWVLAQSAEASAMLEASGGTDDQHSLQRR